MGSVSGRVFPQKWLVPVVIGLPTNKPPQHSQCARRWGMGMFGIGIGLSINDGISISVVTDLPHSWFKVEGSLPMNVLGGWSQYGNGLSINGGTLSGDIVMGDSDCVAAPGAAGAPSSS